MLRLSAILFTTAVSAHYVLQVPTSLGYDDVKIVNGPCGGYDPTTRSSVSEWPVGGGNIGVLTTHPAGSWEINVALVETGSLKWVPLVKTFQQTAGLGNLCFSKIPGFEAWIGKDVVLQTVNHASDGSLYQCAAIKFVAGGAASPPSDCTNGASAKFGPIEPASPPAAVGGGSSSGGSSTTTTVRASSTTVDSSGSASGSATTTTTPSSRSGSSSGSSPSSSVSTAIKPSATTTAQLSGAAQPTSGVASSRPTGGVVTAGAGAVMANGALALAAVVMLL